jgi:hypothetical protein
MYIDEETKKCNLLKTLRKCVGEEAVVYDDINRVYNINYKILIEEFPFIPLINYCNEYRKNEKISLAKLIIFLDENKSNNSSNKIGKVAIIMRLIYEMNGIECLVKECLVDDRTYMIAYGYNWVDKFEIKEKIEPKRAALLISDITAVNIYNHYPGYFKIKFEEVVKDGTEFRYDITVAFSDKIIKKYGIDEDYKIVLIIEVQENSILHKFNANDDAKNDAINLKGAIIKYFFENKIKDDDVIINYNINIIQELHNILIANVKSYRMEILFSETQVIAKKKIRELTEQLEFIGDERKKEFNIRIEIWKQIIDDLDNTTIQVKKMYKYKNEALENPNKTLFSDYNIPLKFMLKNLDIKLNKKEVYYEHLYKLILQYTILDENNKPCFSYETINNFITDLKIDGCHKFKMYLQYLMSCVERIYENHINIIKKYTGTIISKLRKDNKIIKDLVTEKIEKKNNLLIKNYEINKNITKHQIKYLTSYFEKNNIKINKILSVTMIDGLKFINESKLNIYFSKDREKKISSVEILALMLNDGFSINDSKNLLKSFCKRYTDWGNMSLTFEGNETIPYLYFKDELADI